MCGAFREKMDKKPLFVAIIVLYLAQTLQGKTTTFKVQVKNDGGVFNEVVRINLKRKTEKFEVPSQDGFQAAEIIHDFRKKLTMITFPEEQVCYLARLSDNLPNPLQLSLAIKKGNFIEVLFKTSIQSGMMKYNPNDSLAEMTVLIEAAVTGMSDSNVERVKTTMEVKELFQDHTSLSEAMRKQCGGFLIYRIEPVEEVISITPIANHAGDEPDYSTYRNRRGPCSGSVCNTEEECYFKQCGDSVCPVCKEVKVCNEIDC